MPLLRGGCRVPCLNRGKALLLVGTACASMFFFYSTLVPNDTSFAHGRISLDASCLTTTQHLSDPPYENYFYSDCNVDAQAVVTSPLPNSDLAIVSPRLLFAWPAGNSGICTFFQPQGDEGGMLALELVNSTLGNPLGGVYQTTASSQHPFVGVQGVISFNTSAKLTTAILGSIRTIRDFVEGPRTLQPIIQDAIQITSFEGTGVKISRLWLDETTTTTLSFVPWQSNNRVDVSGKSAIFPAGQYHFSATFNYPQLKQLSPQQVLNTDSWNLIDKRPDETRSLSFFSYTDKLLAGGWRFLTYFGRDSMISALLLEPVLSRGKSSAMEAVIGAVLERIDRTDGSVCHEETIGDYATFLNQQAGIKSTAAGFVYPMIDTDFYLPILLAEYFKASPERIKPFLNTKAGSVNVANEGLTWGDLNYINSQKIMNITKAFGEDQTLKNLIHLKKGQGVGQWRDSPYGLANAKIPFDVNCALVPAALYAIAKLAAMPGVYSDSTLYEWADVAAKRARVWEDTTLPFFEHSMTASQATSRLEHYTRKNTFYHGSVKVKAVKEFSSSGKIIDYALAIKSDRSPEKIAIMHTDTAFRLFFLNSTGAQHTTFINATANAILRPFPAGLSTPVGLVVANPALSESDALIAGFTNSAYHGTVVWSWHLALMAKGLERQLARCSVSGAPEFCHDTHVHGAVRKAYNALWDVIEANSDQLQSEVWSWTYNADNGDYKLSPLGVLPPPPGVTSGTESDIRQLWSLTFLAVTRNENYR